MQSGINRQMNQCIIVNCAKTIKNNQKSGWFWKKMIDFE